MKLDLSFLYQDSYFAGKLLVVILQDGAVFVFDSSSWFGGKPWRGAIITEGVLKAKALNICGAAPFCRVTLPKPLEKVKLEVNCHSAEMPPEEYVSRIRV